MPGVARDIESEIRISPGESRGKGMAARWEILSSGCQVADAVPIACKTQLIGSPWGGLRFGRVQIGQSILIRPFHGIPSHTQVALIHMKRAAAHSLPESR